MLHHERIKEPRDMPWSFATGDMCVEDRRAQLEGLWASKPAVRQVTQNLAWVAVSSSAGSLLAWVQMTCLDGERARRFATDPARRRARSCVVGGGSYSA